MKSKQANNWQDINEALLTSNGWSWEYGNDSAQQKYWTPPAPYNPDFTLSRWNDGYFKNRYGTAVNTVLQLKQLHRAVYGKQLSIIQS